MQSFAGKSFPEGAVVKQLGQNWRNAFVLAGPKTAGVLELCTSGTSVIEMPYVSHFGESHPHIAVLYGT